jgi:hypothetical protein
MKHKTLFNNLCKLLGLYFCIAGGVALLEAAFNVVMYWNLRARPFGSWWSLSLVVAPLLEVAAGVFLCFCSKRVSDLLIRSNRPCCPECSYEMTGNESQICTECGLNMLSKKANATARRSRVLYRTAENAR